MRIKIGAIDYKIKKVKRLLDDADVLYGQINYKKCLIRLDADMVPQHERVTLWHEIIHGILKNAGINGVDEQIVIILSNGVAQVLNDNPQLGKAVK